MKSVWKPTKLSEVLNPVLRSEPVDPGKEYRVLGIRLDGGGPFHRETILGSQTAATTLSQVKAGDFIYSRLFAWRGAFGIIGSDLDSCYVSSEFPTFAVIPDKIDPEFLRLWFRLPTTLSRVEADCTGSTPLTRNRFKEHFFLAMGIPLPPVSEQRRIVARIEGLTAKIEEARRLRQKAMKQMEALFASAIDAAFKPRAGWTEARVGEFCEPPQYGYTASARIEEIGPRFLRITDIQNGKVNWDKVPFCDCPKPEQYLLQNNDIVFARTGATTGKSFIIRECPQAIFASYLIRLRVKRLASAEYLYCYFQTPSYWAQITEEKKGTGQANVNGRRLADIRVPIAPPEEQDQIVAYLDELAAKLDVLKGAQTGTAIQLDSLLPSVLDKAFSGEL